jgi:signal transduction histidine kinase
VLTTYLQKVERNLERMNVIIQHIMEFARESKPVKRPLLLAQVIEKSLVLLNEQLRLRNIRIEMLLQPGLMTEGNEAKLEQVFINLLTNARDAIQVAHGEMGGRIHVRSKALSRTELAIEVSDTGIGMDEVTLGKVFQPFFTTKTVGRGTGLGLSISHGIMQDHGGSISCESEAGRGTTFTLRFPRYVSAEDANL